MNDHDVEFLLTRIFVGCLYFQFKNDLYELKHPSNAIKYQSNLIYQNILNEEKFNDWIREENIIYHMINAGLWTHNTDNMIRQLETKIEDLKIDLYKASINIDQQKPIRRSLQSMKNNLNNLLVKRQEFLSNTLEGYALSIKNEFIVCNTLYKNDKRVFDKATNDYQSYSDFNDLVNEINKHTISIEQFKSVARHNLWRSYWGANKDKVFSAQVIDWTDEQRTLVNISRMYDNIYESVDCPSDEVIDDDDMLDGWMLVQRRKIEKDKKTKTFDELNPHVKNAGEVFVMARGAAAFDQVSSMNTTEASMKQKAIFDSIKQN